MLALGIVKESSTLLNVQANERNVSIRCLAGDSVPNLIRTDPTRVRQVLLNLVSNAVKFSEQNDTVEVRLDIGPNLVNGKQEMKIEVKDDGIGMTPDQLKLIFQPFRQADTTTTRKYGGTGLGLAITQRIGGTAGGHDRSQQRVRQRQYVHCASPRLNTDQVRNRTAF